MFTPTERWATGPDGPLASRWLFCVCSYLGESAGLETVSPFLNLPFIMLNQATVVVTKDHSHTGTDVITLACPPAERANDHVRERGYVSLLTVSTLQRQRLWRTVEIRLTWVNLIKPVKVMLRVTFHPKFKKRYKNVYFSKRLHNFYYTIHLLQCEKKVTFKL